MSWPSGAREGRAPRIGCCLRGELFRGQVAETRMGTFPIVLDAPLFDLAACVIERKEDMLIKTFVAQA